MSAFPLRRLLLTLRARYHVWSGRRAYRLGNIRRAGRHFREALASGSDCFEACLLLGKIVYREGDFARAAALFARARSADAARFSLEGFPDDFIEALRERQRTGGRPQFRIVIESARRLEPNRPTERVARTDRNQVAQGQGTRPGYGDFASRDEWLRHREKPAIRPGEGHDVDWDAAAQQLFGE